MVNQTGSNQLETNWKGMSLFEEILRRFFQVLTQDPEWRKKSVTSFNWNRICYQWGECWLTEKLKNGEEHGRVKKQPNRKGSCTGTDPRIARIDGSGKSGFSRPPLHLFSPFPFRIVFTDAGTRIIIRSNNNIIIYNNKIT